MLFASGMAALAAVLFTQFDRTAPIVVPADGYMTGPRAGPRPAPRRGARGAHRRARRRADRRRRARLGGDALESRARRLRPSGPGRRAAGRRAFPWSSTTPRQPRSGSGPSSSGRTCRWRAPPRRHPATPTWCWATSPPATRSGSEALRDWRRTTGSIPGPFEAWLLHRSLATLDVRLERQCANAMAIAVLLAGRDDVDGRSLPGASVRPRPRGGQPPDEPLRAAGGVRPREPRPGGGIPRRAASWSSRPPASEGSTRPPSAAGAGAASRCPRASSGSAPAARMPTTCSPT